MVPEDVLFWVAPFDPAANPDVPVLCRRHADSMVVPRGWTLDDRREAVPRLFRPPEPAAIPAAPGRGPRRRRPSGRDDTEQLALPDPASLPPDDSIDEASEGPVTSAWAPAFDTDDDLDGLLEVRSPLLARAFQGRDRPRR